jgi:hypothetical protein
MPYVIIMPCDIVCHRNPLIEKPEFQNFYACASALPQVFIPESLSILAQTIWRGTNIVLISPGNYFWPPCKSENPSSECKHSLHSFITFKVSETSLSVSETSPIVGY